MLGLRKLCVFSTQCCLTSDIPSTDFPELKNPNTNETITTLAKSSASVRKNEEILALTLTIIESASMEIGEKFLIYPSGLLNSKRKSKDNCVYAGNLEVQGNNVINDILLPSEENGTGKRHFMIKFRKGIWYLDQNKYFIKDMGEGLGTFIRLDRPFKLQNLNIVSFGDSHMIVSLDGNFVSLRFIQGPKTDYKT